MYITQQIFNLATRFWIDSTWFWRYERISVSMNLLISLYNRISLKHSEKMRIHKINDFQTHKCASWLVVICLHTYSTTCVCGSRHTLWLWCAGCLMINTVHVGLCIYWNHFYQSFKVSHTDEDRSLYIIFRI